MTSVVRGGHQLPVAAAFIDSTSAAMWRVDEVDIIRYLTDASLTKRDDTLEQLRVMLQVHNGRQPFSDPASVFHGLAAALSDEAWETRYQCVKLIGELVPLLDYGELDRCMAITMIQLVRCLGDAKMTVGMATSQALGAYLERSDNFSFLLDAIVRHGISSSEHPLKKALLLNLSFLYTAEYKDRNFVALVCALLHQLTNRGCSALHPTIVHNLEKISSLVGSTRFQAYIQETPSSVRNHYIGVTKGEHLSSARGGSVSEGTSMEDDLRYGIVPDQIMIDLDNRANVRQQVAAAEELSSIVRDTRNAIALRPHLHSFLMYIASMLDEELNFQVTTILLDVVGHVVSRLDSDAAHGCLRSAVSAATRCMPDPNVVVRQAVMRLAARLLQSAARPAAVVAVFGDNVGHRSSRVRQMTLDVIIAALLTHPSHAFDLPALCRTVARTVVDQKKVVRRAAIECLSVIAQAMGVGKQQPLVTAVDRLELETNGEGATAAVQARIARRQLPRIGADGLVEYVQLTTPSGGLIDADVVWCESGSVGVAAGSTSSSSLSARRGSLDSNETSFVRSLPPTPRRNASASKGLAKMPWERDSLQVQSSNENVRLSESQVFRLPPPDSGGRFEAQLPVSARQPLPAWDDQPLPALSRSVAVGTADRGGSGILFPELSRSVDVERHRSTSSPVVGTVIGDEDNVSKEEMDNSLRQIRNSATKKQLSKIFERGASLEQLQTPPTSINPEIADEWQQNAHGKVIKTNGVSKSKLPRRNSNSSIQSNGSQSINNNNNTQADDAVNRSQPTATKTAEKQRKSNDGRNDEVNESPVSVVGRSVQMDQTMGNGVYINRQAPPTSRLNSFESLKTGSQLARQPPPVARAPSDRSLHRAKVTQRRINSSSTAESGFEDSDTGDEDQFSRQSSMDSQIAKSRKKSPQKKASDELILPRVSSTASNSDTENPENLRPFKDPVGKLNEAMRQIAVEEWESKCEGLTTLRRLAVHHDSVICSQLHTVTLAVAAEVKNLRSQVTRSAMVCLGDMYASLRRNMDGDLELTVSVLLAKSGESNKFIREDAEKSLVAMVENVTPIRAMNALITVGASHRNVAIRNTTGQLLANIIEIMGPNRVLREVPDKLLPVAARFLLDGSPETRYSGQKIFYLLMTSSPDELERALNKHLEQSTLRNIQDKLDNLRKKGLGDPPAGSHSSRMRRVPSNSQRPRITSAESTDLGLPATPAVHSSAGSRARPLRTDDATLADLQAIESKLCASDWSERLGGVEQLTKFVNSKPDVVRAQITKVFGKFIPCLHDPNSKVNLAALSAMVRMTPILAGSLSSVLGHTIQTVAGNLASKNPDINDAASSVLDSFMENIDASLLLQPFIGEAQKSKGQVKVDLTERISYLIMQVSETKPSHATTVALPFVWHLLSAVINSGGAAPRLRHATSNLVTMLYQVLGNELLAASCNSNVTPAMHDLLNDFLDNASS